MIKTKIRLEDNPYEDTVEYLLHARGIKDPQRYINASKQDLIPYQELTNIDKAVNKIKELYENNKKNWVILVDCDNDGFVSASEVYRYMKSTYHVTCQYVIHTGKKHGLEDNEAFEKIKSMNPNLVIIPDAGTNDILECLELIQSGVEVIVLDHHEKEDVHTGANIIDKDNNTLKTFNSGIILTNNPAIVVNPFICDYPNKHLSGGAVVWKFIQALDESNGTQLAKEYVDMVALSIIGDSMSLKSYENKFIVNKGLSNIKHPLFKAFIKQQSHSLNDKEDVNIIDSSFYIIPLVNAMIRIGAENDKELMFKAFCCINEEFDYQKRGSKEITKEDVYTRVARLCYNTKSRQAKIRDKDTNGVIEIVKNTNLNNNEIIVVNVPEQGLNKSLTGLTAMRVSNYFNKPVILGSINKENNTLSGSVRSTDDITNLKDMLSSTKMFSMLGGHQGAMGYQINVDNVPSMIKKMNVLIRNINRNDSEIIVDSIINDEDIDMLAIMEIDNFSNYIGNDIEEAVFYIPNVIVPMDKISIIGKGNDTIKWINENEVAYIAFKQSQDSKLLKFAKLKEQDYDGYAVVNVVGKMKINVYNATTEPQIIIQELEICDDSNIRKLTEEELLLNTSFKLDLNGVGDDW